MSQDEGRQKSIAMMQVADCLEPLPSNIRHELAENILEFFLDNQLIPSSSHNILVKSPINDDHFIAIHDDDISLIKEAIALVALVYAGLPNEVGFVGAIIIWIIRMRKKSIHIDGNSAAILEIISNSGVGGIGISELKEKLTSVFDSQISFETALNDLKEARRTDGVKSPLIEEHNGRLIALDV